MRRLGGLLQGPHEIQLPRGFVGDVLLVRDGQDWLEVDLDLAEEPVIYHAHVDVAIPRGRGDAHETILDLDDADGPGRLEGRELVAERPQLLHRLADDRGAEDIS